MPILRSANMIPCEARNLAEGYLHPDCFKCGKCAQACPHKMKK